MWKLLLQKFGLSLLNVVMFVIGIFLWGLTLYPFNLPYLLHLPAEETDMVIGSVFALLFVCIVTVIVRTKWCFENDLFFSKEDNKLRPLIGRIVTSQEFIADVIVFAVWDLVISTVIGVSAKALWYSIVLGNAILVIGGTLVFALLDCLLYIIARKKADRRLRKREDN